MERLYHFCCQIKKGQGTKEDDPDPKLGPPSLALGRACVFVDLCVHVARVCLSVFQVCVFPCATAPLLSTQGCLSLEGLCLLVF